MWEKERRTCRECGGVLFGSGAGGAGAARAVAEIRGNDQRARSADLHAGNALIPAANPLAGAELEREWLVAIARAVELCPVPIWRLRVVQPAAVMHGHLLARRGRSAAARLRVCDLKARDVVHKLT